MSNPEKKSWIDAVDCLHWKKPFYVSKFKGIMTRYDDFVRRTWPNSIGIVLNFGAGSFSHQCDADDARSAQ